HGRAAHEDLMAPSAVRWSARADVSHALRPLWRDAEAAADSIEEIAFLLSLIPQAHGARAVSVLGELPEVVGLSVREYARWIDESGELASVSPPSEVEAFLTTVDRLVELGRQARAARRAVTERLVQRRASCAELFLLAGIAQRFEHAAGALSRCGTIVRDHVL